MSWNQVVSLCLDLDCTKILYILLCKTLYSVYIKGRSCEHPLTTYKPQAVGGQSEDIVFNRTSGGVKAGNKWKSIIEIAGRRQCSAGAFTVLDSLSSHFDCSWTRAVLIYYRCIINNREEFWEGGVGVRVCLLLDFTCISSDEFCGGSRCSLV